MTRLSVSGLRVGLGGRIVIAAANLTLPGGALVALVGPNGAGKTTLLRAVASLLPSEGEIRLDGADIRSMPSMQRARGISYLPQGHQVHWPMTGRDVAALGRFPHGAADPRRLGAADMAAVERALDAADARAFAHRDVRELSGGERARAMVARALAVEAPLLLADEPMAALDPRHQLMMMQVLRKEAERGALVVAAMHDLGLAMRFCDLALVMKGGAVAALGPPRDVLTAGLLREVYGVEALISEHDGEPLLQPWSVA